MGDDSTGTGIRRLFSLLVGVRVPTELDVPAPSSAGTGEVGLRPGRHASPAPQPCAPPRLLGDVHYPLPLPHCGPPGVGAVGGHADPVWAC